MTRPRLWDYLIAAALLALVLAVAHRHMRSRAAITATHCDAPGCDAKPEECQMPCSGCCDNASTPNVEPCPCAPTRAE